jgi:hypothetical protein
MRIAEFATAKPGFGEHPGKYSIHPRLGEDFLEAFLIPARIATYISPDISSIQLLRSFAVLSRKKYSPFWGNSRPKIMKFISNFVHHGEQRAEILEISRNTPGEKNRHPWDSCLEGPIL